MQQRNSHYKSSFPISTESTEGVHNLKVVMREFVLQIRGSQEHIPLYGFIVDLAGMSVAIGAYYYLECVCVCMCAS